MEDRIRLPSGSEFALQRWGDSGPTVLLHHATGLCKRVWSEIAEPLAQHCRLIAYDIRGHGDTDAEMGEITWDRYGADLVELTQVLTQVTGQPIRLVVGHSLGGIAALIAMESRPGLFEQGLLLDPVLISAEMDREGKKERRLTGLRTRVRQREFADRESAREALAAHDLYAGWSPRLFDDFISDGMCSTDQGSLRLKCDPATEAIIYGLGETPILRRLDQVKVPMEILASDQSPFASAYEIVKDDYPGLRISHVHTTHMVPMQAPDLVVAAIARLCGVTI